MLSERVAPLHRCIFQRFCLLDVGPDALFERRSSRLDAFRGLHVLAQLLAHDRFEFWESRERLMGKRRGFEELLGRG